MKIFLYGIKVIERKPLYRKNSTGASFHKNVGGFTVLFLYTLSDGDLYFYEVS